MGIVKILYPNSLIILLIILYNYERIQNRRYILTIKGTKFTRICTRTYLSTIRFALKTAFKQRAIFKIIKCNKQ